MHARILRSAGGLVENDSLLLEGPNNRTSFHAGDTKAPEQGWWEFLKKGEKKRVFQWLKSVS